MIHIMRNDELCWVEFDELTEKECEFVAWRTCEDLAWRMFTFMREIDEEYEELE